jgi:hypothetical protein
MSTLHFANALEVDVASNRGSFNVPNTGVYFLRVHAASWPAGATVTLTDSSAAVRFVARGIGQSGFVTLNSGKASWSTSSNPTGVQVAVGNELQ